jgi:hypothetical protein
MLAESKICFSPIWDTPLPSFTEQSFHRYGGI